MHIFLLTALTMIAFAANSVLARLALADGAIDAASYSILRLAAGAITLTVLASNFSTTKIVAEPFETKMSSVTQRAGNWVSALALLAYVVGFSYAYLALDTGTGALILFACVQATMIGWGIAQGSRPTQLEWLGLTVAFGAFIYLVSPGLTAPDVVGSILMISAGVAWGVYSLRGRGIEQPLLETASNFIIATRFALVAFLVGGLAFAFLKAPETEFPIAFSFQGILLAVASGAITSGMGYALWYYCLPNLKAARAAIVQLSVPAIATLGGVLFAGEELTLRLALASVLILGGVAIAVMARDKAA